MVHFARGGIWLETLTGVRSLSGDLRKKRLTEKLTAVSY